MIYSYFETAFGTTFAAADNDQLCHLWFDGQKHEPIWQYWKKIDGHPLFLTLKGQLEQYAKGERTEFNLPLNPKGTEFQMRVWQALLEIPFGQSSNYGALAAKLNKPTAARAVGAAVGKNPLSILIPCHRVIGKDGSLTGFASGLEMKKKLLRVEGLV
ncbi:methylated-DNA--[protein]-cysteine S-methyltransferase [Pelagibaculum spongiae]|uniref:Methylated-DNA--protein-cysteine methyltransferase n=1 Tax=Pelagibaculum spongiae TaxID=2080658 RepID=A0A2V1GWW3_9GAMM|nr:methylated-DNA--[protein]-cysteine S-methyltransferase [Pelagibaculum spongiae]PVZ65417.1 cysteine methyltransferase [Pelagibaculum spongiae]